MRTEREASVEVGKQWLLLLTLCLQILLRRAEGAKRPGMEITCSTGLPLLRLASIAELVLDWRQASEKRTAPSSGSSPSSATRTRGPSGTRCRTATPSPCSEA